MERYVWFDLARESKCAEFAMVRAIDLAKSLG